MILGPYLSSIFRLLLPLEYQIDLAAAEAALVGREEPKTLLVLGKVLLCAGKIKLARDVLAQAETTAVDASTRALAGGYRLVAEFADFNACRDWGAGFPLELARRWSPLHWATERDQWFDELPPLSTHVEQEVWFVTQIAPLPNELALAETAEASKSLWGRLARAAERIIAGDLPDVIAIGALLMNAHALRLVDRRADAEHLVEQGFELCRVARHAVCAGLFALLADDIATTARTVPEVLDLFGGDARELSRHILDALEEGPLPAPPADWATVFNGESTARSIFADQGWHLGVGAALVFNASWITRAKPADVPATFEIRHLVDAKSAFQLAADEAGTQLVDCRLLAAGIEQNFPHEKYDLQRAREIGVWGRTIGSLSFTLGLGFLFLAFARRWRRRGDLACALRAVRLAEALFDGLQAPVASADAAAEEAELLASGWEPLQAVPSWQRALDRYVDVLSAMESDPPAGPSEPRDELARLRGRVAETAARLLTQYAGHDAFTRVQRQLIELNMYPE
jgi:hypothetical protein